MFIGGGNSSISTIKSVKSDLSKIKIWNSDDVELPQFDELTHAEIGKWAIFKVNIFEKIKKIFFSFFFSIGNK